MSEELHERISAIVEAEPGVTMASLLERNADAIDGDIIAMIAARKIYVDLAATYLGDTERVRVFRSKAVATAFGRFEEREAQKHQTVVHAKDLVPGSTLRWNNKDFTVFQASSSRTYLRSPDGGIEHYQNVDLERFISEGLITDFKSFSPADSEAARKELAAKKKATDGELLAAMEREAIVLRILAGERVAKDESEARKFRNWVKWYQEEGLAGLIFTNEGKGNTTPRLDTRVLGLAIEHINEIERPGRGDLIQAYGKFCIACGDLQPCTYKTFRVIFKARKSPEQTEKIEGSRAAYQEEEPVDSEHQTIPVNGDRPWQYVHIDHTVIDLELRHSTKRHKGHYVNMGKVWITLMIDAYSRRILAYYISFDPPSKVSVMMVVRECVRRFNRLPECIVVDNGAEFHSAYFQQALSRRNCDVQWRPPTQPRFGAIMERFIKTMNLQFVHLLEGNTKIMALKLRLITKKVNPKRLALWNLPILEEEIEKYFYEEYDTREHSSLGQSPRDKFEDSIRKYKLPGDIDCPVPYDENFIIDMLPTTRSGVAKVVPSRGVKIYYIFYTSRGLKTAGLYGNKVEVRYDPWDASVAYAFINGRWETLYAPMDLFNKLKNCSRKEMKALTQELRREKSLYGKNFNARAMEMAEQHASREKKEEIEKQRQRDAQKQEAARRTGKHLSVADFTGGSEPQEAPKETTSQKPTARTKRTEKPKTFASRRRRAA